MNYLYAPWRGTYSDSAQKQKKPTCQSIFSAQFECSEDGKNLILKRLTHTVILLNLYPYNPGHLLIVPQQQVTTLDQLSKEALHELMEAIAASSKILHNTLKNSGTNIGFNIGDSSSGGSIPEHLHAHIIPRWHGDTGFLPLLAEVKVLSEDLRVIYEKLKKPFDELTL